MNTPDPQPSALPAADGVPFFTSSRHTIRVDPEDAEWLADKRVYIQFLPSDRPRAQVRLREADAYPALAEAALARVEKATAALNAAPPDPEAAAKEHAAALAAAAELAKPKLLNLADVLMRRAGRRTDDNKPLPEDILYAPRNDDWFDFRKDNLRPVTRAQKNLLTARPRPGATHEFRGVSYVETTKRWRARVQHHEKTHESASHLTKEEAALAYDVLALRLHGHDAQLNFPDRKPELVRLIGVQNVGKGVKTKKKRVHRG